jgi:hypothetical protein
MIAGDGAEASREESLPNGLDTTVSGYKTGLTSYLR